ncbi:MAG: Gfo/Idh/MocA family oxidoreductase [Polyangiaceae bacterium]
MKTRLGFAGVGRWGLNLVNTALALPGVEVAATFDPDESRQNVLPPGVPFSSSRSGLLQTGLDALIVASPPASHTELALFGLDAGWDVFVEKPLAMDLSEAQLITDFADRRGRRVMVGHLMRYHPALLRLQSLSGHLGRIKRISAVRHARPRSVDDTEDPWWALAVHDLTIAKSVAYARDVLDVRVFDRGDEVVGEFRCSDGARCEIRVGRRHDPSRYCVVEGSSGVATLREQPGRADLRVDSATADAEESFDLVADPPLKAELSHFVDCLRRRLPFRSDGSDGVAAIRVLEAGDRSRQLGGTWISLTEELAAAAAG